MLTIDTYTAKYIPQRNEPSPRIGSYIRISESVDDREYDDFVRVLQRDGKDYQFVRYLPRLKMNVYRITA